MRMRRAEHLLLCFYGSCFTIIVLVHSVPRNLSIFIALYVFRTLDDGQLKHKRKKTQQSYAVRRINGQ